MTTKQKAVSTASMEPDGLASLIEQYGCGPMEFAGTDEALYERHLLFDNVVKLTAAGPRERFEAVARSVRDVLSQRWVLTEDTYERENPKRVYYLSMEFLIGRSLANNVTNLLLDPIARQAVKQKNLDWLGLLEAGTGRRPGQRRARAPGGLFPRLDGHDATSGHGLRSAVRIRHLPADDPGRLAARAARQLAAPAGSVGGRPAAREGGSQAGLLLRGARRRPCSPSSARPSTLFGIPFDRPVVGYGGKTINTLRLWAAAAPDYFDFQRVQQRRFRRRAGRDARGRVAHAGPLSRRLHEHGAGTALRAGVFPGRLLAGRPRAALPPQQRRLEHASREGRHPAQRHAPDAWPSPS